MRNNPSHQGELLGKTRPIYVFYNSIYHSILSGELGLYRNFHFKISNKIISSLDACDRFCEQPRPQNIGRSRASSDPFVKLSDVERKPPDILSDLSKTEVYCLSDPSVLVSDQTRSLVRCTSKCTLVQD